MVICVSANAEGIGVSDWMKFHLSYITYAPLWGVWHCGSVCVCMCDRETQRERKREGDGVCASLPWPTTSLDYNLSIKHCVCISLSLSLSPSLSHQGSQPVQKDLPSQWQLQNCIDTKHPAHESSVNIFALCIMTKNGVNILSWLKIGIYLNHWARLGIRCQSSLLDACQQS